MSHITKAPCIVTFCIKEDILPKIGKLMKERGTEHLGQFIRGIVSRFLQQNENFKDSECTLQSTETPYPARNPNEVSLCFIGDSAQVFRKAQIENGGTTADFIDFVINDYGDYYNTYALPRTAKERKAAEAAGVSTPNRLPVLIPFNAEHLKQLTPMMRIAGQADIGQFIGDALNYATITRTNLYLDFISCKITCYEGEGVIQGNAGAQPYSMLATIELKDPSYGIVARLGGAIEDPDKLRGVVLASIELYGAYLNQVVAQRPFKMPQPRITPTGAWLH